MKSIPYYIYAAVVSLVLLSCSSSDDDATTVGWSDDKAPLSMRAAAPQQTRTDFKALDNSAYDVYACAVYYEAPWRYDGYYSKNSNDKIIFRQMMYDVANHLYCMPGYFYPLTGKIDLLTYGVPHGKNIKPKPLPEVLNDNTTADYMVLQLDDSYDGSFEVIAADRLNVACTPSLKPEDLPYAHFHYIQANIHFQFRWADGVAADAGIIDRLTINSVRIENTPCRGDFYVAHNVADGEWRNTGDDAVVTKRNRAQTIPYGKDKVLDFGSVYIVPQTTRQRFIVNYTIQNGSGTASADRRTMNYVVQDPASGGWEAGHGYTYIINIGNAGNFNINNVGVKPFVVGNVGSTVID